MRRPFGTAMLVGLAFLAGCEEPTPIPEPEIPRAYPVRSDLLLKQVPAAVPAAMDLPGSPPMLMLRLSPDLQPADVRALARESDKILDPAKLAEPNLDDVVYLPLFADTLGKLFGTPAEPKVEAVSSEVAEAITELRLEPSALASGARVYHRYCVQCHGEAGGGDGPNGRWLVPHPRDFRQGRFKFVSADPLKPGVAIGKARRDDLKRTIRHGMDGAGMPAFDSLSGAEVEDVISYVIHLSIRGESEYEAMKNALDEISGEWPFPEEAEDAGYADEVEMVVTEQLKVIAPSWLAAERNPVVPDPDPYVGVRERLDAAAAGAARFQQMCVVCHKNYGREPTLKYDEWGTIASPRNLLTGTFRGGRDPVSLYTRLHVGVAGSGMPSFASRPEENKSDSLTPTREQREQGTHPMWQVVHFLRALPDPALRQRLSNEYGVSFD